MDSVGKIFIFFLLDKRRFWVSSEDVFRVSTAIFLLSAILSLGLRPAPLQVFEGKEAPLGIVELAKVREVPDCHKKQDKGNSVSQEEQEEESRLLEKDEKENCPCCGKACDCLQSCSTSVLQLFLPAPLGLGAPSLLGYTVSVSFYFHSQSLANIFHPPRYPLS